MTSRPSRARALGFVLAALAGGAAACSDAHIKLLEPPQTLRIPDGGQPDHRDQKPPEAGPPAVNIDALRRSACERYSTTGEREQALLMMVLDVSNSMSAPFGSTGSRWDAERPILNEAINTMPSTIALGALYYPNMATPAGTQPRPASACVNTQALIPVNLLGAPDSRHRGRIQRSLATMQPNPQAGTPTLDAYLVGLSALGSSTLEGSRQMLLITDGQPTFAEGCVGTGDMSSSVDPGPVISVVDAARRAGVRTYVIGSPGSEGASFNGGDSRSWLSAAAEAGGTARSNCSHEGPRYCHFDLVSEPDLAGGLRSALSDIEERMMRCEFFFTDDRDLLGQYALNLVLTTEDGKQSLLPTAPSENCTQGWHYSDDKQRVVLCENTCAALRGHNQAVLEFLFFGCVQGRP
jgi:hypothetical protein